VLRNCLIAFNNTIGYAGGVYNAGTVENCTVVSNTTSCITNNACGGVECQGGVTRNCIIFGNNNTGGGVYTNWYRGAGTIEYSCTIPSVAAYGSNNVTGDPKLKNKGTTPFALAAGSPCINTGTNVNSWMVGAIDMAGNPRIIGGRVEMGAYEYVPPLGTMVQIK